MDGEMIVCPECGKEISKASGICPHCGFPLGAVNNVMKCPECGNEVKSSDERCSSCGYPMKRESAGNVINQTDNKKIIIGIVLVVIGIIVAFLSYKTRFMGDYAYYAGVIAECEGNIREYKNLKQDMLDEGDRYSSSFFRSSYKDIADGYQNLIDAVEDDINEYKGKQRAIVIKAGILLILAICLLGAGGKILKNSSGGKK